jgi:hypothetical protein
MQPVDMRLGTNFAGRVAEPRDDQLLHLGKDPQRPLGAIGDVLALTGRKRPSQQ